MGTIDHYLDASFVVALLTAEPKSPVASAFIAAHATGLIVSDFAAAEFVSAISRLVRMQQMPRHEGNLVLSAFDRWTLTAATAVEIRPFDIALATTFLRRLDLALRTPDAIHIAATQRVGATLVTLDSRMASAASALGAAVVLI